MVGLNGFAVEAVIKTNHGGIRYPIGSYANAAVGTAEVPKIADEIVTTRKSAAV